MNAKKSIPTRNLPREPVQARGIQTRAKIMDAGEKLFIRNGFHNILADDIARAAGVSVGSFYGISRINAPSSWQSLSGPR